MVRKELENERPEHVASVVRLERQVVGEFFLDYEGAQWEIYSRDPLFKMDWMEISFDLEKVQAREREDAEEEGIETALASVNSFITSTPANPITTMPHNSTIDPVVNLASDSPTYADTV